MSRLPMPTVTVGSDVAHGLIDVSIHHQQIEQAIEIGIEKETAESQAALRKPANIGAWRLVDIDAALGAAVEAQHLVVEIRHHETRDAGVVIIGHIEPNAITCLA